uniref:CCHC-type domain-containing protein n=1 Tax=Electrophorus electricus TaxID=8005 RepID=A0AAY5EKV4_ELEEL
VFFIVCVYPVLANTRHTFSLDSFIRVPFIQEVLFGYFGLHPGALICAQRNGAHRFFDVTLASDAIYRRVLELGDRMGGHLLRRVYILEPLWEGDRRMVTVHFFNTHVSAAEVRRFLTIYGEVLPSERMVRDELGIWNGHRQFMKFSKNSEGQERYPPTYFTYAGNRGYLFFMGQPAFCRGCQDYVCRNCLGPGHQAKDCKNPRWCKACGGGGEGEGHLAHSCPGQAKSHATVLAGGGSAALSTRNSRGEGLLPVEDVTPPEQREEDLPPAALMTSPAGEGVPAQAPRPVEAPPAPLNSKAKRKRERICWGLGRSLVQEVQYSHTWYSLKELDIESVFY